jgi:hypothetical protein
MTKKSRKALHQEAAARALAPGGSHYLKSIGKSTKAERAARKQAATADDEVAQLDRIERTLKELNDNIG